MKLLYKSCLILLLYFTFDIIKSELSHFLNENLSPFSTKSLSTKDLINILKYRGIEFAVFNEKRELLNLIEITGEATHQEQLSSREYVKKEGKCILKRISTISNENEFTSEVEEGEGAAWILLTSWPRPTYSYKIDSNKLSTIWCYMQSVYSLYGIKFGIVKSEHLYDLHQHQRFYQSPFILVLLRNSLLFKNHIYPVISHFPYLTVFEKSYDVIKDSVRKWLNEKLAHEVHQKLIPDTNVSLPPFHFVSIYPDETYPYTMPPASLSTLSVKFSGRIKFWSSTENNIPLRFREKISVEFPNWKPPGHFFISEYGLIYKYGEREGQMINYDALRLFFRHLLPSSNDFSLWSFTILYLLISFYAVLIPVSKFWKLFRVIFYLLIYFYFYCAFIYLSSYFNNNLMSNNIPDFVLHVWQKIATTDSVNHIRFLQLNNFLDQSQSLLIWLMMLAVLIYV